MRVVGRLCGLSAWGFLLVASAGQAASLTIQLCPEEIARLEERPELGPPLPIGCTLVDCCPGCPGAEALEWRIRVTGNRLAGAELHFEPGAGLDTRQLKLSGGARQLENQIAVGSGQSRISNLSRSVSDKGAVAFIKPLLAKGAPRKTGISLKKLIGRGSADDADAEGSITADLYLGGIRVNSVSIRYAAIPCPPSPPPPPAAGDLLLIDNNGTRDNTVVVIDGRTAAGGAGCSDDRVLRAVDRADLPNQLANAGCNSEIAVFSADRAMALSSPVTWADAPGETHRVRLDPAIAAPVSVWLIRPDSAAQAGNDFANANLLYRQNKVGVQFAPRMNDVSADSTAATTIGTGCANAAAVKASAWFTANTLNVYYVDGVFTGVTCGFDPNIIYVGTTANIASLAHEFGHAFSLRPSEAGGHVNGRPGFGNNNIMWGGGPAGRDRFTLGQAFRINVDNRSKLNLNGTRTGSTRACVPLANTPQCPALTLDWARP
jgi:hypothetical protein